MLTLKPDSPSPAPAEGGPGVQPARQADSGMFTVILGGAMARQFLIAAFLLGGTIIAEASTWRPNEKLLAAVRQIESSNGKMRVGDGGRSLGDFQLSEAAWMDVSAWRKARRLKVYAYDEYVFHYFISKAYAADYLVILRGELARKLKRQPTVAELYAAYNMGIGEFAQCGFELSRVNATTRKRAQQVQMLASRS